VTPLLDGICAVVVTYHPDDGLESRVASIARQVDKLVIVDNTGTESSTLRLKRLAEALRSHLIRNAKNEGIATALNQGASWALEKGYRWLLTFDQDSEVDPGMVEVLRDVYGSCEFAEQVAVLGANFRGSIYDKAFYDSESIDGKPYWEMKAVITSGSLISLATFQSVGGFRDDFFIDYVDFEYCLRVRAHGYRVIRTVEPLMKHAIGNPVEHNICWRTTYTSNYPPLRQYFLIRNTLILTRDYILREPAWVLGTLWKRTKSLLLVILLEKDLASKMRFCALGFLDGIRNRTGRFA